MHWTRRVGLVCLVAVGCVNICSAQSIIDSASEVVYLDDFSGSMSLANDGGTYILFSKVVGQGVGHSEGFSRIGIRAKLMDNFDSHLFGEFHGLITDDSRLGLNIGGGYRWLTAEGLFGVNGWYDSQESQTGNDYSQITGGLEYLSPGFDFRTNAYVPINTRENFLGVVDSGDLNSRDFFLDYLATDGTGLFERANYAWDAEMGTQVPVIEWLRAYAGAYFLNHSDNATWGARARLEASLFQGGNLNLSLSNDDKFGTNVNLEAEVRFSGGIPTRFNSDYGPLGRRYAQVRRQWNIQISQDVDRFKVPTLGADGQIIRITHVDANAAAGGNGTVENPLQRLPNAARDSDLVLVRSGGNVAGTIQLIDMQQILGEGKAHFIDVRNRETGAIDNVQLPSSFASTGPLPTLVGGPNPATPVIGLADNSVVRGFHFNATNAIAAGNIENFHLECLTGTVLNGINIDNGHGAGVIRDVNFTMLPTGTGVSVTNRTGGLTLDVDRVTTSGGARGLALDANGGNILYDINTYNGTAHSDAALNLRAENAYLSGNATAIRTSSNTGHGVQIETQNGTGKTTLSNIQSNSNGKDGVNAVADASSNYSLDIIGTVALPSSISMNADDNVDTTAVNTSTMNVFIDPITLASAGDNAYEYLADNGSTINARLDDVSMMMSTNDAVHGVVSRNSNGRLTINNSNGSGSGDDGVDLVVSGTSTFNGTINNSTFSGNGLTTGNGNGIDATATQGSVATLNLNNVLSNANANAGLEAKTSGGGMGPATLTVNSGGGTNFSNNVRSNVIGTASDNSRTNLNMTNVLANGGANNGGLVLNATTGGRVNTVWNGGSISNTNSDGVRANGTNANSRIDLALTGVSVNNNAVDGIDATLMNAPGGQMNISLTNSSLTNNMLNGLDIQIDGNNAIGSVAFNNTAASGNRGDGFQFDVTGGADLLGTATGPGNDFSNNLNNGIDGTVNGIGSTAVVNIDGANANNSGHAGILLDTNNSGMLTFNYSNGSSSNNARDGLFVTAQNNSIANINLNTVSLNGNGVGLVSSGDGFTGIADTNSVLNANLNFVQAIGNREKGFNFLADNGSTITINPTGAAMAAVNNGEEGLFFDVRNASMLTLNALDGFYNTNGTSGNFSGIRGNVTGAGSAASVSFDGSQVTNNTRNGFEFTASNGATFIGELISSTQGTPLTVTGNAGDGASLNAFGAGTNAALITEGTTALINDFSNNGGVGLRATANGINQLAVQASGTFSNNGLDGIQITSNNTTTTAIEISSDSNRDITGNGGDGVNINLDTTALANVNVTTLTQIENVGSLVVSNIRTNNNAGHGINITGNNVDLSNGSINNVNADDNQGDGIRVVLTDSTINTFDINNNGAQNNTANGINVDLTRTTSNGLNISNNIGAPSNLDINFLIDGLTDGGNFALTNVSDPNFDISGVTWNIANAGGGFFGPIFNTFGTGAVIFSPLAGSDTVTGLTQVNGIVGPNFPQLAVPDNSTLLGLTFNDFNPGETFFWEVDLNANQFSNLDVAGSDLIGSTVVVNYNGGAQLTGQLVAVAGNPDAAEFQATGTNQQITGLLNNGGAGLRLHTDQSTLTNTTVNDNIANNNGGHGIDIDFANGTTVNTMNVDNNTTNLNGGAGISVVANDSVVNDLTMDGNTADQNTSDGILASITNGSSNNLTISNSTISASGGRGIAVIGTDSPIDNITLNGNSSVDSMGGDGALIQLTNSAVSGTMSITNGFLENNAGDGLDIDLNNSAVGALVISGNSGQIVPPSNIGFTIDIDTEHWNSFNLSPTESIVQMVYDLGPSGQDVDTTNTGLELFGEANKGLLTVNGNPIDSTMILQPGAVTDGDTVVTLVYNNFTNGSFGHFDIEYGAVGAAETTNDADLAGTIVTATFSNGQILAGVLDNMGDVTVTQINPGSAGGISNNAENGVRLSAINGSNIGSMLIDNNRLDSNGVHGVEFNIVDSTLPGAGAPAIISNNIIENHTNGDGFRMLTPDTNGNAIGMDFLNNTIGSNSGTAINITIDDNAGGLTSTMAGNNINANGGFGIRVDAVDSTNLNLTIGDTSTNANVISNNNDAGIGITMSDNTTGTLAVLNTTVDATVDGTDANFNGQGLAVRLIDSANLSSLTIGDAALQNTNFVNNASNGIEISQNLTTTLTNPTIQNTTSSNNAGDGLNYVRAGASTMDNFTISGSTFSQNLGDGMDIVSGISNQTDEFTINNNFVNLNGGRGLSMQVQFDSDIVASIDMNTFTNNGDDGVQFTEVTSAMPATDSRSITATLTGNTISGNAGQGVDVLARHDLELTGNTIDRNTQQGINLGTGAVNPLDPTLINNNMITNNGSHGIDIADVNNTVTITGNTISGNGTGVIGNGINNVLGVNSTVSDNTINNNADNGVAITNGTHTFNNNIIEMNGDDGIQLISNSNVNGLVFSADGNTVRSNGARGLNLLVSGTTLADVTFDNGTIEGNIMEGVYVVNTASTTQNVDAFATAALPSDGDLFATPELVFNFNNNSVTTNGIGSGFGGTGLVVRVGTSGASTDPSSWENNGGLASDGLGFTAANLTGRGGVLANVTGNTISGNPGADVLFESFVSTRNPVDTVGTWDAATYTITTFEQDALARFDLNFTGNSGDDLDVTRQGASFNNTEAMFKSRTNTQVPAGPFAAGNRGRNAQRLASRSGAFGNPLVNTPGLSGNSSNFLYSGVGGSTFRVTNASTTAGFGSGDNFLTNEPIGAGIGELPFGWDTY